MKLILDGSLEVGAFVYRRVLSRLNIALATAVVGLFLVIAGVPGQTAFLVWVGACIGILVLPWGMARDDISPADAVSIDVLAGSDHVSKSRSGTRLWHALIRAIPDPAVALGNDGRVLRYNPSAQELFPSIRLGQSISQVTRNPELNDAVGRVSGVDSEPVVVEMMERLPIERRISATVARLDHGDKNRTAPDLLICFRDHSEQDRLEQTRSDFVANASHELRTPLASLRGFVDTLQGPARHDLAAQDRFLGIMATQAERMTRLIDDLLSLSRVEMRAHLAPSGTVDVNEVAQEVVQSLKLLAETSGITIKLTQARRAAMIRGDREEIAQVLQNLVQNAVKYGRPEGHVELRVEVSLDSKDVPRIVTATVEDDGVGIAAQHLPRLTERFYRANVASSREKGGTGLGLAIVKHIVARHRATLSIESELGHGSKFAVSFTAAG